MNLLMIEFLMILTTIQLFYSMNSISFKFNSYSKLFNLNSNNRNENIINKQCMANSKTLKCLLNFYNFDSKLIHPDFFKFRNQNLDLFNISKSDFTFNKFKVNSNQYQQNLDFNTYRVEDSNSNITNITNITNSKKYNCKLIQVTVLDETYTTSKYNTFGSINETIQELNNINKTILYILPTKCSTIHDNFIKIQCLNNGTKVHIIEFSDKDCLKPIAHFTYEEGRWYNRNRMMIKIMSQIPFQFIREISLKNYSNEVVLKQFNRDDCFSDSFHSFYVFRLNKCQYFHGKYVKILFKNNKMQRNNLLVFNPYNEYFKDFVIKTQIDNMNSKLNETLKYQSSSFKFNTIDSNIIFQFIIFDDATCEGISKKGKKFIKNRCQKGLQLEFNEK